MRIALDAMGGDHGVKPAVQGALKALELSPDLVVVLVGNQAELDAELQAGGLTIPDGRLEFLHCTQVIGMTDKPVEALRKKPDNSISRSWQLLATKQVDGLVSAGNTGAVVGAGLFSRKFLKGVRKPGIATTMPTAKGQCIILDVGANVFPKPSHMLQYGVMGAVYAKHMLKIDKPTIGLMNVGEEEGKGHDLVQKTYSLFRNSQLANQFIGNVEGRDIHRHACDVIVTDGFVGNVVLKHAEGVFEFIMGTVMKELMANLNAEKETAQAVLQKIVGKFHHSAAGGAPLLGIDGNCIICHGSSDHRSIANALNVAAQEIRAELNQHIIAELANLPTIAEDE